MHHFLLINTIIVTPPKSYLYIYVVAWSEFQRRFFLNTKYFQVNEFIGYINIITIGQLINITDTITLIRVDESHSPIYAIIITSTKLHVCIYLIVRS